MATRSTGTGLFRVAADGTGIDRAWAGATMWSRRFRDQVAGLPERARDVVEYRKSGLSLNHVQGCPSDRAYCLRHTCGRWEWTWSKKCE